MAIINRRHFVRQTAFSAAFYASPLKGSEDSRELWDDRGLNNPSLDAESIRKLASSVTGDVITPDSPEYETARLIFNRAFDRRPAVIVRCVPHPMLRARSSLPRPNTCHWRCVAEATAGSGSGCAMVAW